ncbi:18867_t:CDS:2, partial [Racocetra persica]
MSDNESDYEGFLVFDLNCETSDNISIGSSNGAILVVSQENQSHITKKDNDCLTNTLNSGDSDSSVNVADSEKPILHNIADIKTRWNSKYYSWKWLLKLYKALFDDATTYFSGSQYAILSIIYLLIEALKYKFVEFDITSDTQNNEQESSDDDSNDSEFDTSELTDDSSQIINWDEETQERAKAELTHKFKNIATSNCEPTIASIYTTFLNSNNLHRNRLHTSIFGKSASSYTASNPLAKLECYLDLTRTPITEDNTSPFEWWAIWKTKFPNIA